MESTEIEGQQQVQPVIPNDTLLQHIVVDVKLEESQDHQIKLDTSISPQESSAIPEEILKIQPEPAVDKQEQEVTAAGNEMHKELQDTIEVPNGSPTFPLPMNNEASGQTSPTDHVSTCSEPLKENTPSPTEATQTEPLIPAARYDSNQVDFREEPMSTTLASQKLDTVSVVSKEGMEKPRELEGKDQEHVQNENSNFLQSGTVKDTSTEKHDTQVGIILLLFTNT